jgi:hypothetical protein
MKVVTVLQLLLLLATPWSAVNAQTNSSGTMVPTMSPSAAQSPSQIPTDDATASEPPTDDIMPTNTTTDEDSNTTKVTYPVCDVCGSSQIVGNLAGEIEVQGRMVACGDVELAGQAGTIPEDECAKITDEALQDCNCQDESQPVNSGSTGSSTESKSAATVSQTTLWSTVSWTALVALVF